MSAQAEAARAAKAAGRRQVRVAVVAWPQKVRVAARGHGLASMRERAAALGGALDLSSAPAGGMVLVLSVAVPITSV